jgi:probable HAF family extracellular repeat protein
MPGSALGTVVSGIAGDGSTIAGYGNICTTFNPNGSCLSSGAVQAFRWTPAGGYQTLGSPGDTSFYGAGAVSYDGSAIVGEHPLPNQYAGFRWTAATGMVGLPMNIASAVTPDGGMVAGGDDWWKTTGRTGTFGPFPGLQDQTEGQGLAGTAQAPVAVGGAIKGSDAFGPTDHAFRWTPATGMQDLGVLAGGDQSISIAISGDESVVVGEATVGGLWHAFRRTAKTGMQDLMKLVSPPQRLILQSALGVSADGTVLTGNGYNLKLGIDEPWRAVLPLP